MTAHTELLTDLIAAVYALPLGASAKEIHDLQMLAAEIKGRMLASEPTTQPADDGWIENTGVMPECEIKSIRFANGKERDTLNADSWTWDNHTGEYSITHYKPA